MEGPSVDFNEILQQATQLTAEIESSRELPRVQRNLRQVLEAGQQLLERTTRDGPRFDADTKAAVFLGTKGVDVTKLTEKLDPIQMGSTGAGGFGFEAAYEPVSELDLEDFLRNERMNAMCAIVETTSASILEEIQDKINMRLHEDWKREKEEISTKLSGSLKSLQFEKVMYDYKPDSVSPLSQTELTYAHEINQYNNAIINGLPKPNLVERLQLAAKNTGDTNAQELWNTVSALVTSLPIDGGDNLPRRRSSEHFINLMNSRARNLLERNFFTRLQTEVWSNFGESNIGGVPAVIQLVKSYISMKGLDGGSGLDIGAGSVGPVWLIAFLLLRCGKASDAAAYMRDQVCNTETAQLLEDYDKSGSSHLPFETESKIRLEYRRALKNSTRDPYKKAVYCILGGCNVEEDLVDVASRLDDYIWLKLSIVRHNPDQRYVIDYLTYFGFQKLIHEQYGEVHFDAFQQPYVYAQALLLTGQFEAAIEFMSRIGSMLSPAIHIAVALHEANLLLISDAKAPMLSEVGEEFPDLNAINFCKLVVTFAQSLEGCNARDALNYLYLLKSVKDENGEDLFSICVGDMILESRDFDVLGIMNVDGCRSPGLLDQMGIPSHPIILRCATESENTGLLEDSVVLYDLAGDNDRTLKTLCRIISQNMTKIPLPDSPRQRVQRLAVAYAERYQNHPPKLLKTPALISTFFMLVDFLTFFDTVYSKQVDSALSIIQRLKVLPMDRSEVEKCVEDFHTFPSEIRDNIPSIVAAAMEVIHLKFQSIKTSRKNSFAAADQAKTESYLHELRTKGQAIVTFCGMIPYFMTDDIYLKVMQIEVQMN